MSRPFEDRRPNYDDRRGHDERPSRYEDRPQRSYEDRPPRGYDDRRDYGDRRGRGDFGYPGERRYDDRREYAPAERRDFREPPRDFNRGPAPRGFDRPPMRSDYGAPRFDSGNQRGYESRNFQAQYPPRARAPNQLFVGSLAFSASEEDLRAAFPNAVTVRVQRERDSMRSRGFGFVAFATPEEASEALRTQDGVDICGRPVKLAEANQSGGPARGPEQGGKSDGPIGEQGGVSTRSRSRSRQRQASWAQDAAY